MPKVSTPQNLDAIRKALDHSRKKTCTTLRKVLDQECDDFLLQLKFEPLGCHPVDSQSQQTLTEQINLHATYLAATEAVEMLMKRHPDKEWIFEPGHHGRGHDIESTDKEVAAEVFSAVHRQNNRKLSNDKLKIARFQGPYKYIFYRCHKEPASIEKESEIIIVSLGPTPAKIQNL